MRTDAAKDFTSKKFQEFMKKEKIHHFVTHNETQANYVERFIQTIKSKINRYIVESNSERYIDVLQQLVDSYNNTWHSGIRYEPINVNKENENILWWQMYWPKKKYIPKKKRIKIIYKFDIGDKVRLSYTKSKFDRKYTSKWTHEIFTIYKKFIHQGQPIYKVKNWFNEKLEGSFYQPELQKVNITEDNLYKIDNIIKSKGSGKNKKILVSWLGWPNRYNSWIPESELQDFTIEK